MVKVFVAGGSGLVGSSLIRNAPENFEILAPTRAEVNLEEKSQVSKFLEKTKPDAVILAAAKVGGILANSRFQRDFLVRNLEIQDSVIMTSRNIGIPRLVFLGSSCIYPRDATQPISESSLMSGPLEKTNEGYALAKIAGVRLCKAIADEDGLKYFSLMPTNLYGPNDNFHPENSHVPAALLRRFHEAKIKGIEKVMVWGSGKPRREFMHVDDLADACWTLMEKAEGGELLNVGTGKDVSITEFSRLIAEVTEFEGEVVFDTSRPDGTPRKLLDVERIHGYGWKHKIDLKSGIAKTYDWFVDALDRGTIREY